ncbi:MAG: hypothetical protein V4449_00650 [Patescibacteria group bacterium]
MLRATFALSLLFLAPVFASAEILPTFSSELEIGVNPAHPRPGSQVTLTVSDPGREVGTTAYVWSLNGEVVDQGIDHTSIAIILDGLGTTETIRVIAVENNSARADGITIIRPASVDILWEGNTYTPALYIGRPLPNGHSSVTLMAIPHLVINGAEAPSNALVYSWKVNNVPLQKQSGYGKWSAVVTAPSFGGAFTVSVVVSTQDGSIAGEQSLTVQPQTPSLVIYEDAPLLGVRFDKAHTALFPLTGDEVSFVAYPLSIENTGDVSYTWTLDTVPFTVDPTKPQSATFRKVGTGSGAHTVRVSFENIKKFLEHANTSFQLTF